MKKHSKEMKDKEHLYLKDNNMQKNLKKNKI